MTYMMKPLVCDPKRIKGMSEKLIVSHHENNYGGAVKRLNAIAVQLTAGTRLRDGGGFRGQRAQARKARLGAATALKTALNGRAEDLEKSRQPE